MGFVFGLIFTIFILKFWPEVSYDRSFIWAGDVRNSRKWLEYVEMFYGLHPQSPHYYKVLPENSWSRQRGTSLAVKPTTDVKEIRWASTRCVLSLLVQSVSVQMHSVIWKTDIFFFFFRILLFLGLNTKRCRDRNRRILKISSWVSY